MKELEVFYYYSVTVAESCSSRLKLYHLLTFMTLSSCFTADASKLN